MKKVLLFMFLSVMTIQAQVQKSESKVKPRVIILATGGTIAGVGDSVLKAAYKPGKVPVEDLLNAVPEIQNFATVKGEQVFQMPSQDMTIAGWLKLSKRINEIFKNNEADGVVVTHGTDTQEETAYFLDLTVQSQKPVVLVGAMRPSTGMSQDGNKNLLDAVIVAADPKSHGVVLAMNEVIYDARDVTKTNTTATSTFQSRNFGPIGLIYDSKVSYYYESTRNPKEKFDVMNLTALPKVEIVYGYADASPAGVIAIVNDKAKGIVYSGMGNGNYNKAVGDVLTDASKKGVIICRAARAGGGRVTLDNEIDDKSFGFVVSDDLSAQKARILLMLALTKTSDFNAIQKMFFEY